MAISFLKTKISSILETGQGGVYTETSEGQNLAVDSTVWTGTFGQKEQKNDKMT